MKSKLTYNQFCKIIDDLERRNHPVWPTADLEHCEKLKSENIDFDMKRGKEMRKKFYTLSYIERLDYWFGTYAKGEMFNTLQVIPDMPEDDLTDREEEDKKLISIFPQNNEERDLFFEWKVNKRLAERKSKFSKVMEQSTHISEKKEFIEAELKNIEASLHRVDKENEVMTNKSFLHYKVGYNSRLNKRTASETIIADAVTGLDVYYRSNLVAGMADFEYYHFLKDELEELQKDTSTNSISKISVHWSRNKNQLYDVIRFLKQEEYITNSYTDLAVFLKFNFDNFHKTSLSTIETELHRGKRPAKGKRINLPITHED